MRIRVPTRVRAIWNRYETAPAAQLAIAFLWIAIFNLEDPLTPINFYNIVALALLIIGALTKLVGRLWDNRHRTWPLYIEAAGNLMCIGALIMVAAHVSLYTQNWQEAAGNIGGYALFAKVFALRLLVLRGAIKSVNEHRHNRRMSGER